MAMDAIDAMLETLERERAALKEGALDGLARLAREKEQLLPRLIGVEADRSRLVALQKLAAGNARLLEAVRRGAASARALVAELRRGGPAFNTYDRTGQRSSVARPERRLERRA